MIILLIVILLISAVGFIYWWKTRDTYIVKVKKGQVMDFKYPMKISGLPVIIFSQNGKDYNFLFDTGSNASYINEGTDIVVSSTNTTNTFIGADGINHECNQGIIKLTHNDKDYRCVVSIANLKASFEDLKNTYGVTLHGIIGTDFMKMYSYCIDFKEFIVYCRK